MIVKEFIAVPAPSARDLAVVQADTILAKGDYRLIVWQPPLVTKGKKNWTTGVMEDEHVLSIDLRLSPLKDPQDITSVSKGLSVKS